MHIIILYTMCVHELGVIGAQELTNSFQGKRGPISHEFGIFFIELGN